MSNRGAERRLTGLPRGDNPAPGAAPPRPGEAAVVDEAEIAPVTSAGVFSVLRDWQDAIVIAIVLAMFVRVFIVELFVIPSGSMTPTLIGGQIARVDYNNDGRRDLLFFNGAGAPLLFLHNGRRLVGEGPASLDRLEREGLRDRMTVVEEYDKILVNKLSYWFRNPRRGEIAVFKVPERIWTPDKPIYIKRVVGEPGDVLGFDPDGRVMANGRAVTAPVFFADQRYDLVVDTRTEPRLNEVSYLPSPGGLEKIREIHVPRDKVYLFGDNTHSSLDSRYWGAAPLKNMRGRAFLRIWPMDRLALLRED